MRTSRIPHPGFRTLLLAVVCSANLSAFAGDVETRDLGGTLPLMTNAPTVDGKIAEGEWSEALAVSGFQFFLRFGPLDPREGISYIGYTEERLYIAVVTELPPDKTLIVNNEKADVRDFYNIGDDGVELLFDPNRQERDAGEKGLPYYHFIGNSIGAISDLRFQPAKGAPDLSWNADWTVANGIDREANRWVFELAVPFADLGWEGSPVGRTLGVLIARNWKRPGQQTTAFPHRGPFADAGKYPRFTLVERAPVVQVRQLGRSILEGRPEPRLTVANPTGEAVTVKTVFHIHSSDVPARQQIESHTIAPGATQEVAWDARKGGALNATAEHVLTIQVLSADETETYLSTRVNFTGTDQPAWAIRDPDSADLDAAVRTGYLPSYNLMRVRVDTSQLEKKAAETLRRGTIRILDAGDEVLAETPIRWDDGARGVETELELPDLPNGEYKTVVALEGYDHTFVRPFRRIHFPFEKTNFGVTRTVYPPFAPIEVDDDTLKVVERKLTVNDLGLWSSVVAAEKEVLAGPVVFATEAGPLPGSGEFTSVRAHEAVYEGGGRTDAVHYTTRCTTEYDGCMKVELTLAPARDGNACPPLWLDIPLRAHEARLMHASTTKARVNPAGAIPPGEGRVWDSRKLPNAKFRGNFIPYLWLGRAERGRGLCWFADNDRNWVLKKEKTGYAPSVEVLREGDTVRMRVNLIQEATRLDGPRTLTFGLMASPGKPMDPNWRATLFDCWNAKLPHADDLHNIAWIGAQYWGSDTDFYNKYPRHGDFSVLNYTQQNRFDGVRGDALNHYMEQWEARHLPEGVPEEKVRQYKQLLQVTISRARHARRGAKTAMNAYWEVFWGTCAQHPEAKIFKSEWSGQYDDRDLWVPMWRGNTINVGRTGQLYDSYQDFALYYGAEFIRRGVGLYCDNCYPTLAFDPLQSEAYVLPDGEIQPSATMWRRREYLKRMWVLHQQYRPANTPAIMMLHMTNTHIVPTMVWNESNLDLEWYYGTEPQQSKYPHALLRAESIGLQTGNIPLVLASIPFRGVPEEEVEAARRTRFGVMMTHEIKVRNQGIERELFDTILAFGYGQPDCAVYNYWQDGYPLALNEEEVKSLLLRRGDKALAVFCSWLREPVDVTVAVRTDLFGEKAIRAVDAETGKALRLEGDAIALPMKGYGVRMVEISPGGE